MVRDHWSNDVMVSMDCCGLYCIGSGTLGVGGPRNIEVSFMADVIKTTMRCDMFWQVKTLKGEIGESDPPIKRERPRLSITDVLRATDQQALVLY